MKVEFEVAPENKQFIDWAEQYAMENSTILADVIILALSLFRAGFEHNMKMYYAMSPEDEKKYARKLLKEALTEYGRLGGKSRSLRKQAAARQNGKRGGRPKKRNI